MYTKIPKQEYTVVKQRFYEGESCGEIARTYRVSPERIRQILNVLGVDFGNGGSAKRTNQKRLAVWKHRNRRFHEKYGMGPSKFSSIQCMKDYKGVSPYKRYRQQKSNARERGVEWKFTFASWWAVWEASGKWEYRRRGDGYVMARCGDTGPYSPENVKIITASENSTECRERNSKESRARQPHAVGHGLLHDCEWMCYKDTMFIREYTTTVGNRQPIP